MRQMKQDFKELHARWKSLDPALVKIYKDITILSEDRDVLILYNGANLHPDFVNTLNLIKVYTAGDDPESTNILTKPLSQHFDIHLVNNIACVDMYKSWGFKHVHFWPLGSLSTLEDVSDITKGASIGIRQIPIIFVGGSTSWRRDRFNKLISSFPNAKIYGNGWVNGPISYNEMWKFYRNTQIGWNLHNSTGPINFRTYELPAYQILQICDNKSWLRKIFELAK